MTEGSATGADRRARLALGTAQPAFDEALAALDTGDAVERIWRRDAAFWSSDSGVQAKIADRLGWLDVAERMRGEVDELATFAGEVRDAGIQRVILLGMGGSSLCVEVLRQVFGSAEGYPLLTVVDTTDPATIRALDEALDYDTTLFVVASKSGGTLETLSHAAYFFERAEESLGTRAGSHFVAITDPGSRLARLGRERGYRRVFLNPPDIGGRYSVLSYFGLVPGALAGIDIATLLDRALAMMAACRQPVAENPGARLGALLGGLATAGHDKATLILPTAIASFGDWAEQLIAESTGKEGRGIVPVTGEPVGAPEVYGDDRIFVHLYLRNRESAVDLNLDRLEELAAGNQPLARFELDDPYDLGGEFFHWEFATAVAGQLLGINPFDEPNVQESKDNTSRILAEYARSGRLPEPAPVATRDGLALVLPDASPGDFDTVLADFLNMVRTDDYLALLAYVAMTPVHERALQGLRLRLRDRLHVATTLGYGPRFLHSTGQLHKGGANNGVFLQFVAPEADGPAVPIPGQNYDFGTLKAAQALGDLQSLQAHGRRVARIDLGADIVAGLARLNESLSG